MLQRNSAGKAANLVTRQLTAMRAALVRLGLSSHPRRPVTGGWLSGRFPHALGSAAFRRQRDFLLYIPTSVSWRSRVPLLVMLHGCRQNARSFASGTRMTALADEQRFIILYP